MGASPQPEVIVIATPPGSGSATTLEALYFDTPGTVQGRYIVVSPLDME